MRLCAFLTQPEYLSSVAVSTPHVSLYLPVFVDCTAQARIMGQLPEGGAFLSLGGVDTIYVSAAGAPGAD